VRHLEYGAFPGSTINVNGIKLFYRDTGPVGQPLLCLHGRWGRGETWTELMSRLGGRYRVIAPDQRGHGLSDKPDAGYAAEDFVADAIGLLESLECGPAVVVGHSMGARIAAHLTAAFPARVSALALLDEGSGSPAGFPNTPADKIPDLDNLTKDWPTPYKTRDAAVRDLCTRFGRKSNVAYFLDSLVKTADGYDFLFSRRAMTEIGRGYKSWNHLLPRLECPVLLVRASNSWVLSAEEAEYMRTNIPDCTYYEVTNSDHMVYADNPDEFYGPFEEFLARV
jgi:2-succinyl-6-hydroxy-2,4-cyclohexadiene-1-carboxylate synthase